MPAPHERTLQVRAAGPADLEAIARLHTAARAAYQRARFPDAPFDTAAEHTRLHTAWHRVLGPEGTPVLCAVRQDTVVGAAAYRQDVHGPATAELHQLHVDPGHWGTGVGRSLHTACLHAWRAAGCSRAVLDVLWHNHRARSFYTRLGWRPDPRRRPAPDATHLALTLPLTAPAAQ
ncbi:GNAT family N-acetyltransferase [Streptomyces gilvosporeus]|uniref:GNAT family N-acetyltransferase n=1 Tax=Streptomyces gilvosporeus TaxID=553510 RepID=A0A1V0TP89_9ACTN|nr:GNAT family N-acetyltransferase [Streptomyces gilvosporeus]ARF54745.1 GNAT family N-acetyltransferase [Streptomyces gilvosporeus]